MKERNSEAETPYAWLRLTVSLALSTIGGVGMWSVVVALPAVQAEFGVARGDASLPYTLTMIGFGLAFSFIPMSIAALAGVEHHEAGLASGLINTSQQIGGALGVAIAATVAFTHTKTLIAAGHDPLSAQTSGFSLGFWVLAAISAVSVLAAATLVRGRELEQVEAAVQAT